MVRVEYLYIRKSERQGDAIENIFYGYTLTVCPMAEKVAVWSSKRAIYVIKQELFDLAVAFSVPELCNIFLQGKNPSLQIVTAL